MSESENQFIAPETPLPAGHEHIRSIATPERPVGGGTTGGGEIIKNPVDGSEVKRADYIRALASKGWTRSQIVKHLAENGHDVRYQTVYQATNGYYPKRDGDDKPEVGGELEPEVSAATVA